MDYVSLGRSGLPVSRLALGTAAFGFDRYGIHGTEEAGVTEQEAIRLVRAATDHGINLFDTARSYGGSEAILGRALAECKSCVVATKVSIPQDITALGCAELTRTLMDSVESSLHALHRGAVEIVQIHNATRQVLEQSPILNALERVREQGKLQLIGASVYGEEAALSAIRSGKVDVLQIALNVLDQRMMKVVLPEAKRANVGVIARSALLKGVLTKRAKLLPPVLSALAESSHRVRELLGDTWESLPRTALRFCLSVPGVHSVLVGLQSLSELPAALEAQAAGALEREVMRKLNLLQLSDERLLNPSFWPSL